VEVPDPLQNRLRVGRVPSHHLALALGFACGWGGSGTARWER
jgi:hypothetical protein